MDELRIIPDSVLRLGGRAGLRVSGDKNTPAIHTISVTEELLASPQIAFPNGVVTVTDGGSQTFNFSVSDPEVVRIYILMIDGIGLDPLVTPSYTFNDVHENHTIYVGEEYL